MPATPAPDDPDGTADHLVRLGPADAGELLTLQRAAYVTEAQLHDDVRLPPLVQTLEQLRAELAGPAAAWGLRRGPRLVAAVRLRDLGHGSVDLGRLMVAPDLQGQGLGSRLLLRSEALVPAGTREIHLFTGERSEANLRLYRRHGYVETHRTPAGGHDLVHLVKVLAPEG
ncbi:GNAT family N-acetyltransferase [Kineosporia sp. R_H_3]|uniref:GNAT family N-acetyltransferase n=1 Tax=Kineosporia sp. R_H_3 TaxID=1961848 RepID=UPI000B4AFD1A|nr:GNAT family N-acetyltransferase [Kineosporia sp. R_H_3]